jgi:hypothetical protein
LGDHPEKCSFIAKIAAIVLYSTGKRSIFFIKKLLKISPTWLGEKILKINNRDGKNYNKRDLVFYR